MSQSGEEEVVAVESQLCGKFRLPELLKEIEGREAPDEDVGRHQRVIPGFVAPVAFWTQVELIVKQLFPLSKPREIWVYANIQ